MADENEYKPFRIQVDGHRKYLFGGQWRPSVTTILSQTETAKSKASLANWAKKNPGAKEEAAARGTAIHACCEDYLRGKPIHCPEAYLPFWQDMDKILDLVEEIHWSEKPLRPDWYHLRSPDKEFSAVWSERAGGWCGCPDLICEIGGVKVLADFKTSNAFYRNSFPERGDSSGFGGWRKYTKTVQQMASYAMALEERTGYRVDCALIIVSTEAGNQAIFVDRDQLSLAEAKFLKRCEQYHALFPADEQG